MHMTKCARRSAILACLSIWLVSTPCACSTSRPPSLRVETVQVGCLQSLGPPPELLPVVAAGDASSCPFALCLDRENAAIVARNHQLLIVWVAQAWRLCRDTSPATSPAATPSQTPSGGADESPSIDAGAVDGSTGDP
jgi:hypothetical protein